MKILLFGKDGQVGWELQRSLSPLGEMVALDLGSQELCGDFSMLDDISQTVQVVSPDIIVNAAAHTAVDKAEGEPEQVRIINTLAPAALAQEAAKLGAWLIHYSTDYVFDGSGNTARVETDPTNPLNVYGMTKLEAENAILQSGCNHIIFRTSWVFAARGGNFAKTMLRLAQQRDSLNVIDDQVGAPTSAELLADITAHVIRSSRQRQDISGLYHLVAAGETSWYGYANFVLNFARQAGVKLTVAPENVFPVHSSKFPSTAKRPMNSRLDTRKLQSTFDLRLPSWETGVARTLTEILEKSYDSA